MNQFELQLESVKKAYDKTVIMHDKGMEAADLLPDEFYNSKQFQTFVESMGEHCNSDASENWEFLKPTEDIRLLDVGCCANMANYRLDRFRMDYYGIDVSPKLIKSMADFSRKNNIKGNFYVSDMASTGFEDNYFDLGMAIGVLEYFSFEYAKGASAEFARVLKPGARAIIDIPNSNHKDLMIMLQAESYLERQNAIFDMKLFEEELGKLFNIEQTFDEWVMKKYFIKKR